MEIRWTSSPFRSVLTPSEVEILTAYELGEECLWKVHRLNQLVNNDCRVSSSCQTLHTIIRNPSLHFSPLKPPKGPHRWLAPYALLLTQGFAMLPHLVRPRGCRKVTSTNSFLAAGGLKRKRHTIMAQAGNSTQACVIMAVIMHVTLFLVLDSDIQGNAQGSKDPDGEAIHHHTCPV